MKSIREFALSLLLVSGLAMIPVMPAVAHHSFAGYDLTQTLTGSATIKEFRWGAPHSTGVFVIKSKDGKESELTLASSSPTSFLRQGFNPRDFKVGEKVDLSWHPSKSGAPGGLMAGMKLKDGRVFNEKEYLQTASGQVERQAESAK